MNESSLFLNAIGNSYGIPYSIKRTACENAQLAERKFALQAPLARGESRRRDSIIIGRDLLEKKRENTGREKKKRMAKRETYEQRTEALVMPIIEANKFELVDVEYVKEGGTWYLRAYIDKPGGITVDDCELVNRALSDLLDQEDFIDDSYILEVSSPGLGRPLKKEKDFIRSMGEEVEIRTYRMVNKQKEFRGILKAYDKDTVTIETEEEEELTLERENIALIRLAFDF